MPSLRQAYQSNRATFYHFAQDGSKVVDPVWIRNSVLLISSVVLAIILDADGDAFLNASISAASIVLGFAFSVLVLLATQDPLRVGGEIPREKKGAQVRINVLADELFDNIGYFLYVSLSFVILASLWQVLIEERSLLVRVVEALSVSNEAVLCGVSWLNWISKNIVQAAILFVLAESTLTFLRIIRRILFYFSERKKLIDHGGQY